VKISILTPDLSHNCLGRAYLLAKILQKHYEVEIVGPLFGKGIWEPLLNDKSIRYQHVRITGKLKPYQQIRQLAKKIDGDVIYASKPLFSSFGMGLLAKHHSNKPLILDIDDWQSGIVRGRYIGLRSLYRYKYLVSSLFFLYSPLSIWNSLFGEALSRFADEITVSNDFLRRKFGGTLVCHARDTEHLNPEKFDKRKFRDRYRMPQNKKVVMFFGTPRPYKGLDDLVEAISMIVNRYIVLVVVGIDYKNSYCLDLVRRAKSLLGEERFIGIGLQPFKKMPEFLAMADAIVIPQRRSTATVGQVPAKLFDAMAMAKPIIATNVSEIPNILGRYGLIIQPGNPIGLAEAIKYILGNLPKAQRMGRKARQKAIAMYSWKAVEERLLRVFDKYAFPN